eukprot:gene17541-19291_t
MENFVDITADSSVGFDGNKDNDDDCSASGTFFCEICKLEYVSKEEFEEHSWSLLHHKKLDKEKGRDYVHLCSLCGESIFGLLAFTKHLHSSEHQNKMLQRKEKNSERLNPTGNNANESFSTDDREREDFSESGNSDTHGWNSLNRNSYHQNRSWTRPGYEPRVSQRTFRFPSMPMRPPPPLSQPSNQMNQRPLRHILPKNQVRHRKDLVFWQYSSPKERFANPNVSGPDTQFTGNIVQPLNRRVDGHNTCPPNKQYHGRNVHGSNPRIDASNAEKSNKNQSHNVNVPSGKNHREDRRSVEGLHEDEQFQGFKAVAVMKERIKGLASKRPLKFTSYTPDDWSKRPRLDECMPSTITSMETNAISRSVVSSSNPSTGSGEILGTFAIMSRTTDSIANNSGELVVGKSPGEKANFNILHNVSDDEEQSMAAFLTQNADKAKEIINKGQTSEKMPSNMGDASKGHRNSFEKTSSNNRPPSRKVKVITKKKSTENGEDACAYKIGKVKKNRRPAAMSTEAPTITTTAALSHPQAIAEVTTTLEDPSRSSTSDVLSESLSSSIQSVRSSKTLAVVKGEATSPPKLSLHRRSLDQQSVTLLDESLNSLSDSNQCEFLYQDGRRCPSNTDKKYSL